MSAGARPSGRLTRLAVGRHVPYRTARMRLTLLYGGLFLLSGAALMVVAYLLLVNAGFVFTLPGASGSATPPSPRPTGTGPAGPLSATHPSARTMAHWRDVAGCMRRHGVPRFPDPVASAASVHGVAGQLSDHDGAIFMIPLTINVQSTTFQSAAGRCGYFDAYQRRLDAQTDERRTQVRESLLIQSGIALAAMSLLSLGLGWLMAGRVLRPLADAYEAQRQFVANASHELRAPLTRLRALTEVALAEPARDIGALRQAHERVLDSEQHLEAIIDGLLALTRGRAGLERREPVELAALAREAASAHAAGFAGLDLSARLAAAVIAGDPRLLERVIRNLIDNAIRYNIAGGRVEITTGTRDRRPFLSVSNTGPPIPPEQVQRLLQPFQRLEGRARHDDGHGLGLSIVQAVADAHGAELTVRPGQQGGLVVTVSFPPDRAGRRVGAVGRSASWTRPRTVGEDRGMSA